MRTVGSAVTLPESRSGWHLLLAVPPWASYLTNPGLRFLTSKIELITVVPCGPVVKSFSHWHIWNGQNRLGKQQGSKHIRSCHEAIEIHKAITCNVSSVVWFSCCSNIIVYYFQLTADKRKLGPGDSSCFKGPTVQSSGGKGDTSNYTNIDNVSELSTVKEMCMVYKEDPCSGGEGSYWDVPVARCFHLIIKIKRKTKCRRKFLHRSPSYQFSKSAFPNICFFNTFPLWGWDASILC